MLRALALALGACVRPVPEAAVAARGGAVVEVALGDGRTLLVSATEVTQRAWREHVGTTPWFYRSCDACPADFVSWYDAATYANALSRAQGLEACYALVDCAPAPDWSRRDHPGDARSHPSGLRCAEPVRATPGCAGWRLPSVGEWSELSPVVDPDAPRRSIRRRAVVGATASETPWVVASREPNERGLYDTVGNLDEWLDDPGGPPAGSSAERAAEPAWCSTAGTCFGTRMGELLHGGGPELEVAAWGRHCLGFRVVRTLSAGPAQPAGDGIGPTTPPSSPPPGP